MLNNAAQSHVVLRLRFSFLKAYSLTQLMEGANTGAQDKDKKMQQKQNK
jgi:hypothetical protein